MLEINVLIHVYMEMGDKYTEHPLPVPQDLPRGPYRSLALYYKHRECIAKS